MVSLYCRNVSLARDDDIISYGGEYNMGLLSLFVNGKCESPIETRLYNALTKRGYRVKCQRWIGKYRVDLCIPICRLVIECDGQAFHSSPAQKKYDKSRTSYLNRRGWKVIRFTGSQINKSPWDCVRAVEKKMARL